MANITNAQVVAWAVLAAWKLLAAHVADFASHPSGVAQ